jgi:hypothetical protein
MLFTQVVSINTKPFAPELIRAERVILYLFFNKVYGTVKCLSPISRLRLIFNRLIVYPRQESCPRVPCFSTARLSYYTTLLRSLLGLLCEVLDKRGLCV